MILREDQLRRVIEEISKSGGKLIFILTDGDIKRASSLAGQIVYKASPLVLKRLQVEKVPSIVTQEDQKLRVKEMIPKFLGWSQNSNW